MLRIARETGFGYVRILGELRKLGITGISRSTVVNILKEKGLPTGPQRGEATWTEFLKRHANTLWACDFLTLRVLTPRGLRYAFVLVFMHPATRVAHVSHFIVLGTRHLDHLFSEYIDGYYNRERPHSSLGFAMPASRKPPARAGPVEPHRLRCQERLGGVLKHYHWKAA